MAIWLLLSKSAMRIPVRSLLPLTGDLAPERSEESVQCARQAVNHVSYAKIEQKKS